ncbi:MAG: hypothetical protein HMLKMBBP_02002 [Planctomycetes bacterium]|nr:hypothetical protein [Planctomycetota bacterium]
MDRSILNERRPLSTNVPPEELPPEGAGSIRFPASPPVAWPREGRMRNATIRLDPRLRAARGCGVILAMTVAGTYAANGVVGTSTDPQFRS